MKAAIYRKYGPPQVIETAETPRPTPGPHDILVKVQASTVSSGDRRARSLNMPAGFGLMGRPVFGMVAPRQPILGAELSGVVVAIGAAVTRFRVNDQVFAFTGAKFGCHAEYRVLPEDGRVLLKPAGLSWEEAAALSFGGTTALYFLKTRGNIRPGDSVLVLGASGCVGTAGVQLARHFGARVTGVCSAASKALVSRIGADDVIDYRAQDFTETGQSYDLILDTAGTAPYGRCEQLLKPGGRLLVVQGTLAQALGMGGPRKSSGRKLISGVARPGLSDLRLLADLAETGAVRPVVDRSFPLAMAAEAHAYVEEGHKVGSVVLTIGSPNSF